MTKGNVLHGQKHLWLSKPGADSGDPHALVIELKRSLLDRVHQCVFSKITTQEQSNHVAPDILYVVFACSRMLEDVLCQLTMTRLLHAK